MPPKPEWKPEPVPNDSLPPAQADNEPSVQHKPPAPDRVASAHVKAAPGTEKPVRQRGKGPPGGSSSGAGKPRKPEFSAGLLSQQIAEVGADMNRQRNAELLNTKIVYAKEMQTHRLVIAAYEQAWQEKIERIGNLNYPDEARRDKLSGGLVLAVGIKPDGSVYSIQLQQSSGYAVLDEAARHIVNLATPFAPLPEEIRQDVDVLVITRTWRFDSNYRLETRPR
jgi:periplasmic protein TonB